MAMQAIGQPVRSVSEGDVGLSMGEYAPSVSIPGSETAENGPVTRMRLRYSRLLHVAMCLLGALPWFMKADPALQAFGWGLWLPGLGFVSTGGWSLLLLPATLVLFGIAFVAWFGSGMIVAPVVVWIGGAFAAAALAGTEPAPFAPYIVPGLTIGYLGLAALNRRRLAAAALDRRARREAGLQSVIGEVRTIARTAEPPKDKELSPLDLSIMRYALDRALQPIGQLKGFDKIDQFQTSALRYQLNQTGWMLGILQRHHLPNFHGYLSEAQRRLIEQYLQKPIWDYWRLENLWGNLSLDGDPAKKDNIMLTGYFSINALLYANNTGDDRYGQPGALTFRNTGSNDYRHDIHSIVGSMLENYDGLYRQPFCFYPCEPNWIYSACNFRGMTGIRLYDTIYGTQHFDRLQERFRFSFEREFVRPDGGVIPIRSKWTGHALPFPVPDAVNVKMIAPLYTDISELYWALVRSEDVYREGGKTRIRISEKGVDFGNYKAGNLFAYDGYLGGATEIGDDEVREAARNALLESGRMIKSDGVTSFRGSNLANVSVMESWFNVAHGWRNAVITRPSSAALNGPVLAEAKYPDVLVAAAESSGEDLSMVLYPGTAAVGPHRLSLARLRPGASYRVVETGMTVIADADGCATFEATLEGRTPLRIVPAA